MQFLINGADFTPWLETESLHITRKLNAGEALEATIAAAAGAFTVPAIGARVVVVRADGRKLFTGYLVAAPRITEVGVDQQGAVQRFNLSARSDNVLLDRKRMPPRPAFLERSAGNILRQLVADTGVPLDTSAVEELESVPRFASSQQLPFSELARRLAQRTRAAVRIFDDAVSLRPTGDVSHTIDEANVDFTPHALTLESPDRMANDLVVLGRYEPRAYVKDYFIGDGLSLAYNLSQTPFTRRSSTLLEDEFRGTALDVQLWTAADPGGAFSVSGGRLNLNGGPGTDGAAYVSAAELIEIGGALDLQHGELEITAASDGVIGGLYTASISRPNCLAGFRVNSLGIRAFINGAESGPTITAVAGRRYALSTRIFSAQPDRRQQTFHSSASPAGAAVGGQSISADARFILEVHEIDPANPGTQGAASTVLYDGVLANAPAHCTYAIANAGTLYGTIRFVRLLRMVGVEVRSTIPSQSPRSRLIGSLAEGAECVITGVPQLIFFSPFVPVPNETIIARYRSSGRSQARKTDAAGIAALANGSDNGVRTAIVRIVEPAARNSTDCEAAAAALLADTTQTAWQGSYECWTDFLPSGPESDPLPGDAITISAPSRGADFTATLREVEIAVKDLAEDRSIYKLRFANDSADPLCWEFEPGILREPLDEVIAEEDFVADLPTAEITAITSTTITVDCGVAPPAGGGMEVRRTDFAWGAENDRNLIGRFTTQSFSLPRLARIQTYCVRQFDSATPRKYSRHSTLLHIDYPF